MAGPCFLGQAWGPQREAQALATGVVKKQHELEMMQDSMFNIIEVTGIVLGFMRMQFLDAPATRREKRSTCRRTAHAFACSLGRHQKGVFFIGIPHPW